MVPRDLMHPLYNGSLDAESRCKEELFQLAALSKVFITKGHTEDTYDRFSFPGTLVD